MAADKSSDDLNVPNHEAGQRLGGNGSSDAGAKKGKDWLKQAQTESAAKLGQTFGGGGEGELDYGFVENADDILNAIAAEQGMERVLLSDINFTKELIDSVPEKYAKKYGVIPVRLEGNEIWLALSDPQNIQAIDDLRNMLGKTVHGMVASQEEVERAIAKFYDSDGLEAIYDGLTEDDDPGASSKYDTLDVDEGNAEELRPVIQFVNLVFRQAVHEKASDIHIEPHKYGVRIRFRIDGVLHEMPSPPRAWQNHIISRLKVLSNMDLAEKRVPLDGRIRLQLPGKKLDLRVSTLPTIYGESIVMRILDAANVSMGLEDVGFLPASIQIFNRLIKAPNGVILMTGPTGSGKTTTLYAALGVLNTPDNKLITLEDPVEYQIPGINQIQIAHDIGLTFALGLKAALRQSPDVILVGEIRDMETAENAIRAALTGHLVFSTLHTNDAPSATTRLIEMGVKPYLVASSLQAAMAQRLVRRVCSVCRKASVPDPQVLIDLGFDPAEYEGVEFYRGDGCDRCNHMGYRGRTAIHEIMVMDSELRRRVIRSEAASRIKRAALKKGMRTLRMDGFEKALMGWTSLEEIASKTQSDA